MIWPLIPSRIIIISNIELRREFDKASLSRRVVVVVLPPVMITYLGCCCCCLVVRCNVCHCSSFSVDNQENLADVTQYYLQRSFEESLSQSGRMSAARRALQKTAATQTATATADNTTCTSVTPTSSRTPEVPPDYLTLSPRTAQASASSSRKSSRRRKTSRDSSSRKAYTSIDSDTDERFARFAVIPRHYIR